MGKAKKSKLNKVASKPYRGGLKKEVSSQIKSRKAAPTTTPLTPFNPADRILLVGEGDFSFSHSLLTAHGCSLLVATSLEKASVVKGKYSQSAAHIAALEGEPGCNVLYGVDATKLGKRGSTDGGGKEVKKGGFNRVVFNFPHIGGLTRDVNRQVRHNQELLVGFFKSAGPLLALGGLIIVTMFEGEPYDLWNVRDLARHAGLRVVRSFKFLAGVYPGYKHTRTLGDIEGGGGWKGEDRPARTYVFDVNDGTAISVSKKRRKESDSEDD